MPVTLKNDIYWVGAVDWNLRDFHGYVTGRGATYNSYLLMDEKVTLVDTVKEPFYPEMIERIGNIIDPAKIDYLICNHIEPDHSGSIPLLVRDYPDIKIYATQMAKNGLDKYYGTGLPITVVKTGDTLNIGKRNINFLQVPMVHWPDSMFSYIPEEKLLLSNDGFGQHIATSGRFDDEVNPADLMYEAQKYYANLLSHLSPLIQKALKTVADLKLEIDMIAPSHGIIWRKDPEKIINAYQNWNCQKAVKKVSIVYDTMWKSTEKMGRILAETIADAGYAVKFLKLRENHRSDIVTEILDSCGFLVGSPTMHMNLYPTVADFLCYLKGLKPQNKVFSAFGSYGWSGEAVDQILETMKGLNLKTLDNGIKTKYRPDAADTDEIRAFAHKFIDEMKNINL